MFIVVFEDNSKYTEADGTWLAIPDKPIKVVMLNNGGNLVYLAGGEEYWFCNEAVAVMAGGGARTQPGTGQVVAQIIGCIRQGIATEIRQEVNGTHTKVGCEAQVFRDHYAPKIFKRGIPC